MSGSIEGWVHAYSVPPLCCTLCNPLDCSPLGSSVQGIFQARKPKWVAISSSRGSSWLRHQTHVSCVSYLTRCILYCWAIGEALKPEISCQMYSQLLKRKIAFYSFYMILYPALLQLKYLLFIRDTCMAYGESHIDRIIVSFKLLHYLLFL